MKTIVDVVNEFRGVWIGTGYTVFAIGETLHYGDTFTGRTICSRKQFDQCVAEMSSGQFVPLANKSSEPEIQYDSDGNGYQVGAIYEFSDYGKGWFVGRFQSLTEDNSYYKFVADNCSWKYAREYTSVSIGKIHKKTVKLIDGDIYRFELNCTLWAGFYRESRDSFFTNLSGSNKICAVAEASQISRLIQIQEKNQ